MNVQLKPLEDQVIVITGATSGIGLTTARMAADRGAKVLILVARSEENLYALEKEINGSSASVTQAVSVTGDVADKETLRRAANTAMERFGGIDTWVNNAGVSIYGRLQEVSEEDHRRLFETNFWGLVHGSHIAVKHMRQHGGALINIGSTLSERSIPIQGMYAASKHAVKAYTDALRMELEEEEAPISVTLIKPSAIDTPYTAHAKNYMEDFPNNPPPVYAPDLVAETILYAAEHPVRDLFVGGAGKGFAMAEKFAPRMTDMVMENMTIRQMHSGKPRIDRDSLHTASNDGLRERGDYDGMVREMSCYTAAVTHPLLTLATAVGVGALAAAGIGLLARQQQPTHWYNS